MFKRQLLITVLVLGLVSSGAVTVMATEDGLGLSTSSGYSYVALETGPFVGEIPILSHFGGTTTFADLGVSLDSPWEPFYFGGMSRWNVDFVNDELGFKDISLFAGYQLDWNALKLKLEFGPKFDKDFVLFNTDTWAGMFRVKALFNPFDLFPNSNTNK